MNRRHLLAALAAFGSAPSAALANMSAAGAYRFSFQNLHGGEIRLGDHAGRPILIVNTASFCGFASQMHDLEKLHARYAPRGLLVLGVPSGDFGGQEAGSDPEIARQATHQFGITFPMATKTVIRGEQAHPFFRWALAEKPGDPPRWNFHKYLIGPDGRIAAAFSAFTNPLDERLIGAIGRALEASART
jgi:glutathione peroxidase